MALRMQKSVVSGALNSKVVAVPMCMTATGAAVVKLIADEQGRLVLGGSGSQLKAAADLVCDEDVAYPIQVDLERPNSVNSFFKIAIGQFGHVDAIVLETIKSSPKSAPSEQALGLGARRLLYCLDAALRYCSGDLHIINISPAAGRFAVPVATAFLNAKLATNKAAAWSGPVLRMSIISPVASVGGDQGTIARTIVHALSEPRLPDMTEMVFWRKSEPTLRRAKPRTIRSKIMAPL